MSRFKNYYLMREISNNFNEEIDKIANLCLENEEEILEGFFGNLWNRLTGSTPEQKSMMPQDYGIKNRPGDAKDSGMVIPTNAQVGKALKNVGMIKKNIMNGLLWMFNQLSEKLKTAYSKSKNDFQLTNHMLDKVKTHIDQAIKDVGEVKFKAWTGPGSSRIKDYSSHRGKYLS